MEKHKVNMEEIKKVMNGPASSNQEKIAKIYELVGNVGVREDFNKVFDWHNKTTISNKKSMGKYVYKV